jgi:ABC-type transport system involved in cytochrome c biogenesis permease subunit
MSILILSRPYEGSVLILILLATLIFFFVRQQDSRGVALVQIGVPVAVALMVTAIWLGYYNWRVTRNPLRMPQQAYVAT